MLRQKIEKLLAESRLKVLANTLKKKNAHIREELRQHWDEKYPFEPRSNAELLYDFWFFQDTKQDFKCESGNWKRFRGLQAGYVEYCDDKDCGPCRTKARLTKASNSQSPEAKEKRRRTMIEKYGVDNPFKSEDVKNRIKETNLKKYGSTVAANSKSGREKAKKTLLERYGVEHPSHSPEIQKRTKETLLERYGVTNPMFNDEIRAKHEQTILERYGATHIGKSKIIREKVQATTFERYGTKTPFQNKDILGKTRSTMLERYGTTIPGLAKKEPWVIEIVENPERFKAFCEGKSALEVSRDLDITLAQIYARMHAYGMENRIKSSSRYEQLICEFLDSLDVSYERNRRTVIRPKELDIWIPDHNLGIEFHGLYWHSESRDSYNKRRHVEKYELAQANGIHLIQIFEDEWIENSDLIKSLIQSKLGIPQKVHYARKARIEEIAWSQARQFLSENHLQGAGIAGSSNIALTVDGEIVALAVFGPLRKLLGAKSEPNKYELYRFCNPKNTFCVGGFERILKFFIDQFDPAEIISYSDNRYFTGETYQRSKFEKASNGSPGYWYTDGVRRYHRASFTKRKLVEAGHPSDQSEYEIMLGLGYDRIWDCGHSKWIWRK